MSNRKKKYKKLNTKFYESKLKSQLLNKSIIVLQLIIFYFENRKSSLSQESIATFLEFASY